MVTILQISWNVEVIQSDCLNFINFSSIFTIILEVLERLDDEGVELIRNSREDSLLNILMVLKCQGTIFVHFKSMKFLLTQFSPGDGYDVMYLAMETFRNIGLKLENIKILKSDGKTHSHRIYI